MFSETFTDIKDVSKSLAHFVDNYVNNPRLDKVNVSLDTIKDSAGECYGYTISVSWEEER